MVYTPNPQHVVASAARECYNSDDGDDARMIRKLLQSGHMSPLEHAVFTFELAGVSRALLAQITRHRIASFSVQSQRYVHYGKGFDYIVPPTIKAQGEEAVKRYQSQIAQIYDWYSEWALEVPLEDARLILPNATATKLFVTMNARELLHFFNLRCCRRAQWEIREVAWAMLAQCVGVAPDIFREAGPRCIKEACPEGKLSCARPYTARERDDIVLKKREQKGAK